MKPSILICGQTGTGKSFIVNFCLRKTLARIGNTAEPVRNGFPPPKYQNDSVIFYDSDGYEINSTEEYKQKLFAFLFNETGVNEVHVVWYTINAAAHRVTPTCMAFGMDVAVGKLTIDKCPFLKPEDFAKLDSHNDYRLDELTNNGNKRNIEDVFTSGEFAQAVKKHIKSERGDL